MPQMGPLAALAAAATHTTTLRLGMLVANNDLRHPAALACQLPIAIWADRGNRVRIAMLGAAVWAFFSLLTGFSVTVWMLIIARSGAGTQRYFSVQGTQRGKRRLSRRRLRPGLAPRRSSARWTNARPTPSPR